MINKIQEVLLDEEYNLQEFDGKVILFKGETNHFPEDYIEIEKESLTGTFIISEIHRDIRQIKLETKEKEEASFYAAIIYKKLYDDIVDRNNVRHIRNCMNLGEDEKALNFIIERFDNLIYSIGYEDIVKISLLQTGDKVDIKFGGTYLAESVTLSRGYVIFYNYCEKVQYISTFYNKIQNQFKVKISCEKIIKWYILGK